MAILHVRGAWGEENTRFALQSAKRKKLIWGWVDSITVEAGDIDHLVITRAGGVLAIDSKWRSQSDAVDRASMVQAARRTAVRARGVIQTVLRGPEPRNAELAASVQIRPVVVMWGAVQDELPYGAQIDGVDFVGGRDLVDWLARLADRPISRAAAKDVLQRIENFRASAWDRTKM
jgi:hypothetical protein